MHFYLGSGVFQANTLEMQIVLDQCFETDVTAYTQTLSGAPNSIIILSLRQLKLIQRRYLL
jgi:hypothetical protein